MNLLLRADAGTRIGTGHVLRCLALAQAWEDAGGKAVFALAAKAPGVEARLAAEGMGVERLVVEPGSAEDARQTADQARQLGAEWVVIDGYHYGGAYQQSLKEAGLRVLAIDDYGHADHYHADLVLNQNLYADDARYTRRAPSPRLLLGTQFVLLRREFQKRRGWQRPVAEVAQKVLVTLGGSDPDNVTLRVVQGLLRLPLQGRSLVVVVGASNPHLPALAEAVRGHEETIALQTDVTDMCQLMAWADVAVAAAGTTAWELAFLGLPSLLLVLADNQVEVGNSCGRAGIAVNLGWQHSVTAAGLADQVRNLLADRVARAAMSRQGQALIDGWGAERVAAALRNQAVFLRPARAEDCRCIWEWANDPVARQASFHPEPIPWEHHRAWFARKLADPACVFWIAEALEGMPLAQVRFDLRARQAVISIAVAPTFRQRGYGSSIIPLACARLLATGQADAVLAYIRAENGSSRHAFLKAGFGDESAVVIEGKPALCLTYKP